MPTINDLLGLAIQAENNNQALYERFCDLFVDHPEVSQFWARYSKEELGHAIWIENLRKRLTADRLLMPVDHELWDKAMRLTGMNIDNMVAGVENLQDAWEMANELEHGETNVIFEFLIGKFAEEEHTLTFLRSQLRDHLGHLLIGFPNRFQDSVMRRSVLAKN